MNLVSLVHAQIPSRSHLDRKRGAARRFRTQFQNGRSKRSRDQPRTSRLRNPNWTRNPNRSPVYLNPRSAKSGGSCRCWKRNAQFFNAVCSRLLRTRIPARRWSPLPLTTKTKHRPRRRKIVWNRTRRRRRPGILAWRSSTPFPRLRGRSTRRQGLVIWLVSRRITRRVTRGSAIITWPTWGPWWPTTRWRRARSARRAWWGTNCSP